MKLADREHYGEGVRDANGLPLNFAGSPFRRSLDNADSLVGKGLVRVSDRFDVSHATVFLDGKTYHDSAGNAVFLGLLGVFEVHCDPLGESVGVGALEFGLLGEHFEAVYIFGVVFYGDIFLRYRH